MSRIGSRTRGRMVGMRRWDGRSRITTDWFGYHNDPELYFSDGDVLVFLHEPGRGRRGASFRLHAEYLATTGFQSLVDQAVPAPTPTHWAMPPRPDGQTTALIRELYLPAPASADKNAVARYHLATRNFFAWLYDRPLTGKTLGASLVEVMSRAHLYRPNAAESNTRDMLAYLDRRGYMDFRECVDHALAALNLAETFQMEALWVNAFSHCVGMNHSLHASIEFDAISRVTKAMITRARLEMDIRLDRVARSLTTFFDNDLSGSYLGLTQTAKDHMDRFRSFLHAYYIESHGFWPPSGFASSFSLRRSLYRSMYVEFRALYQYLVDLESTPSLQHNKPTEGGMCTLQNVKAFDDRYRLETLPHPLPLLPRVPAQSAPLGFTTRKRRMEKEARNKALIKSLSDASNRDSDLAKSRLVRRYCHFEKQSILDDFDPVNLTEGRKIRWILIYAILQILASVISAPNDVRDTEGLSYPLCCQRPITMPWVKELKVSSGVASPALRSMKSKDGGIRGREKELRPDVDYITSQRSRSSLSLTTASATTVSHDMASATASPSTTITSKSSRRPALVRLFQKKAMSSTNADELSDSSARSKSVSFHEILVYGYGNGLNETIDDTPRAAVLRSDNNDVPQHNPVRTTIDNSSFIKTATSPPTAADQSPISHLKPPPLSINRRKTMPSPLLSIPFPPSTTADSPTVPTTPSSSRASSSNSTTSHTSSSNTSHSSDEDEEEMERGRTTSTDTATAPTFQKPKSTSNTPLQAASLNKIPNPTSSKPTPDKTLTVSSFGTGIPKLPLPSFSPFNLRSHSPYSVSSSSINVITEEDVEEMEVR